MCWPAGVGVGWNGAGAGAACPVGGGFATLADVQAANADKQTRAPSSEPTRRNHDQETTVPQTRYRRVKRGPLPTAGFG